MPRMLKTRIKVEILGGNVPQLVSMKLRDTLARLIVKAYLQVPDNLHGLGDVDQMILHATLGISSTDINMSNGLHKKVTTKFPNIFRGIKEWRIVTKSHETPPLDTPLIAFSENEEETRLFAGSAPLSVVIDANERIIHVNRDLIDLSAPPARFISEETIAEITRADHHDLAVLRGIKTAIFEVIANVVLETIRAGGCINTFVREYPIYVGWDFRVISCVAQSSPSFGRDNPYPSDSRSNTSLKNVSMNS
jgi:hypothetical protein